MALRTKLVLSFSVLLLLVITGFGIVASRSVDTILIDQIDKLLVGFRDRASGFIPGPGVRPGEPGDNDPDQSTADEDELPVRRDAAEIWISETGEVLSVRASGFVDDPDPLPDVSLIAPGEGPVTIPSVDGSLEYRATTIEGGRIPGTLVVAVPLTDVAEANTSMLVVLALTGLGVLLIGGTATWFMVDRSMRPVAEMVDTAEAIAAGDLTRRIEGADPNTEIGRLGVSLNDMMLTIETAVEHEREGQETLRRFVADASHELRTPIAAVSGYAQLHDQGGLQDPDAEERAWQRIGAESRRMGNLVEDLLALARLDQPGSLDIANSDIITIIRDAVDDHEAIDQERRVTVVGDEAVHAMVDSERLHQVVSSLLSNVRTHTPPGTAVEIRVDTVEDRARVVVKDDGPGLPADALDHVFERFYRADDSRSRKSGGSGLGLAIADAIVDAHGGSLSVENDSGAVFTITLPLAAPSS